MSEKPKSKGNQLRIKINDHLTIEAKDIRNIAINFSVKTVVNGEEQTRRKICYASNLGAALKICARNVPLYSDAKKLEDLKKDYDAFIKRVEGITEQYRLPDAKEALGDTEAEGIGLYGKDFRNEEDAFIVDAKAIHTEEDGIEFTGKEFMEFVNDDEWDETDEDWDAEAEEWD